MSYRTREEIASLFYNHVKAVNQIYEGTNFNGIYGIKFVIQRISVGSLFRFVQFLRASLLFRGCEFDLL